MNNAGIVYCSFRIDVYLCDMQRIIAHIEHLLLTHDCVIVPGLGGFVLQSVSASYSAEEHIFRPMRKDLLFNSTLKHQDGLLVESYMKKYAVAYQTAIEMVNQDVEVLLQRLHESGRMELGSVGSLHIGSEGQFIFTAAEENPLNVGAYGLPSFYLPPLSLLKRDQDDLFTPTHKTDKENKTDAIYIRINKNILRVTAAVAAVVAFVLLISTPIREVPPSTYTASFIPSGVTINKPTENANPDFVKETTSAESETIVENRLSESAPIVKKTGKTYYIIIGSFPNEELGKKFISQIDQSLSPNVGYVAKGNKVRVYSDKFDNREEAESYLSALRQTDKHKDAWLFISR